MLKKCAESHAAVVLLRIFAFGFYLRARGLGRAGFNEDEANKVEAAQSYLEGKFRVNLEHPMLLKSLATISMTGAHFWNQRLASSHPISDEFAVRPPNALFGSLTAIVILLLAREFFGANVGLLSALFWSVGTISITVNRTAKEDNEAGIGRGKLVAGKKRFLGYHNSRRSYLRMSAYT